MITSADVVVIGSGAFGASAAYHAEHRGGLPTPTVHDRYFVGPLPGVAAA